MRSSSRPVRFSAFAYHSRYKVANSPKLLALRASRLAVGGIYSVLCFPQCGHRQFPRVCEREDRISSKRESAHPAGETIKNGPRLTAALRDSQSKSACVRIPIVSLTHGRRLYRFDKQGHSGGRAFDPRQLHQLNPKFRFC
jgi:hypothetical protein